MSLRTDCRKSLQKHRCTCGCPAEQNKGLPDFNRVVGPYAAIMGSLTCSPAPILHHCMGARSLGFWSYTGSVMLVLQRGLGAWDYRVSLPGVGGLRMRRVWGFQGHKTI